MAQKKQSSSQSPSRIHRTKILGQAILESLRDSKKPAEPQTILKSLRGLKQQPSLDAVNAILLDPDWRKASSIRMHQAKQGPRFGFDQRVPRQTGGYGFYRKPLLEFLGNQDTPTSPRAAEDYLRGKGINPGEKTVERTLRDPKWRSLNSVVQHGTQPGDTYSIDRSASIQRTPVSLAITLSLALRDLDGLLPAATRKDLRSKQPALQGLLKNSRQLSGESAWLDYVRVIPRMHPLVDPAPNEDALGKVHEALVNKRKLLITYRSPPANTEKLHKVSVLGLVRQAPTFILVVWSGRQDRNPYTLNVDRIVQTEVLTEPSERPIGFNLDRHIESGRLHILLHDQPGTLALRVRADPDIARVWIDHKLSRDQRRIPVGDDGTAIFTATVPNTVALRAYLLGFGRKISVLYPPELVEGLRNEASGFLENLPRRRPDRQNTGPR